ncbi:MAG TPA: VanZ family protein, partial [Bacteroidia bacterium]|nr:VanZ family protein [Bacteroidia bacterium]
WRMLLIFSGCVIGLECSQMILHRGSLDVDDLMLNVVGAMIGYAMLIGFSAIFRSIRRHPVP